MADWQTFIANLRDRVAKEGRVSLAIDEIIAGTQTEDTAIRERWFWLANQRGSTDYEGFTNVGLSIDFVPDVRGQQVEFVTFHR
jgi:hypothetical protein